MSVRRALVILVCLCVAILTSVPGSGADAKQLALVYNGPGSAQEAPEALASVIRSVGLEIRYFKDPAELPALLDSAVLLAVGGTDDYTRRLRESFAGPAEEAILRFMIRGGRYCGICGGAYLAAAEWEEDGLVRGFGLAPVRLDSFLSDATPALLSIRWQDKKRDMYYQLGPYFEILDSGAPLEELAWYDDDSVAALICAFGKGKVLLSGPHPEAPDSWLEDEMPSGTWKPSIDLLQAALRDLMSDRAPGK